MVLFEKEDISELFHESSTLKYLHQSHGLLPFSFIIDLCAFIKFNGDNTMSFALADTSKILIKVMIYKPILRNGSFDIARASTRRNASMINDVSFDSVD